MKRLVILASLCAAFVAAPSAGFAATTVLDFSGNICGVTGNAACGNYSEIGQSYGDIVGLLDVSYRSIDTSNNQTSESFLKYWDTYAMLNSVAWGGLGTTGYVAEITFTPAVGQRVTLNSLDFGSYTGLSRTSSMLVIDAASNTTVFSSGSFGLSTATKSVFPAVSSATGLILRWGPDSYNVGVDNIALSITAVPEPGTWAMMAAGLAVLGAVARRRRRVG